MENSPVPFESFIEVSIEEMYFRARCLYWWIESQKFKKCSGSGFLHSDYYRFWETLLRNLRKTRTNKWRDEKNDKSNPADHNITIIIRKIDQAVSFSYVILLRGKVGGEDLRFKKIHRVFDGWRMIITVYQKQPLRLEGRWIYQVLVMV